MADVTQAIAAPTTQNAIELVKDDHKSIRAGFDALLAALRADTSEADRQGLLSRLALRLRAHGAIEVASLYPVLREAGADAQAAVAEHAEFERALEQLSGQQAPWPNRLEALQGLAARVMRHFDEEERGLLARAPGTGVDLLALGTQMAIHRGELLADLGTD